MSELIVKTKEKVQVNDKVHTWKHWFNGIKHFFTVKVLPPRK
jgi:hypothetical protein